MVTITITRMRITQVLITYSFVLKERKIMEKRTLKLHDDVVKQQFLVKPGFHIWYKKLRVEVIIWGNTILIGEVSIKFNTLQHKFRQ